MSPLKSDSPAGTLDGIARICHEANRGYQQAHPVEGIPVALPWDEFVAAYPEQAEGIREGVDNTLNGADPATNHEAWCEHKRLTGWTHGPVKDPDAKTHPCLVSYDELPADQKIKDHLFHAIVHAIAPAFGVTAARTRRADDMVEVLVSRAAMIDSGAAHGTSKPMLLRLGDLDTLLPTLHAEPVERHEFTEEELADAEAGA